LADWKKKTEKQSQRESSRVLLAHCWNKIHPGSQGHYLRGEAQTSKQPSSERECRFRRNVKREYRQTCDKTAYLADVNLGVFSGCLHASILHAVLRTDKRP
jgi:hypothetical protein